jgi:hypothetical protein
VIFSYSGPYRKPLYTNIPAILLVFAHLVYNYILQIENTEFSQDLLRLKKIPQIYSRILIFFILNVNFAVCAVVEYYLVPAIQRKYDKETTDKNKVKVIEIK